MTFILLILSDLPREEFADDFFPEDSLYFRAKGCDNYCKGCFCCWAEHPGRCVKNDGIADFSLLMSACSDLLLLTKNTYGCYSPPVKNVLERSISYVLPDFTIREGETHHKPRYKRSFALSAVFYGDADDDERQTARRLVTANAVNLNAPVKSTRFFEKIGDWGGDL